MYNFRINSSFTVIIIGAYAYKQAIGLGEDNKRLLLIAI